ncbi:MAG: hydroxymethylbilane synthase [Proteobacteria bacterium]|nr:hydroxymethylbilane synthase [Pseudomonadota bacterium]
MQQRVRIGTRSSPLALAQAEEVKRLLLRSHTAFSADDIAIVTIQTTGDRVHDRRLLEIGGKGLFTKEIEEQLLAKDIDLAVHSSKDMPTKLPEGLELGCFLKREDPRDAFISPVAGSIRELPRGAIVGTASLRRQAQLSRMRPDLKIVSLRGNVGTRLKKLASGEVQATLLALAGLKRLGLEHVATAILDMTDMLPAPAQGAVCIELCSGDQRIRELIAPLHDADTGICVTAERALLAALDGDCRTPIAALAQLEGDRLVLTARILSPDGVQCFETTLSGDREDAAALGTAAGEELRQEAGADFFAALEAHLASN